MKRIVLFIGLKVAELTALICACLMFCRLGKFYIKTLGIAYDGCPVWLGDFLLGVLFTAMITGFLVGSYFFVRFMVRRNWEWVDSFFERKDAKRREE